MKKLILAPVFMLLSIVAVLAQQGTISGTIIDGDLGEGLIGANVVIENTTNGVSTDFDGKYQLKADAGTYTIVVSYIGYAEKKIEGVEVKPNEVTYLDVTMSDDAVQLDLDVVVTAKVIERSENAVLLLQKKSDKIQDGISSQEMAKLAVGNAAGAMRKVTGATVSGGKYIYIRGLGDRYSLTQLNDLVIPSSDPYRNGAQLDLIPANLLDNIITSKTFTPDQPGTFTGGAVNIKTKSFPEQFSLRFSTSAAYNKQNNFNDGFLSYAGGSSDYWGYDDGGRDHADELLTDPDVQRTFELEGNLPILARIDRDDEGRFLAETAERVTKYFNPDFTPEATTSSFDHGYGLSFGNQYQVGKNPLGVIASASFKKTYTQLPNYIRSGWELENVADDTLFNRGNFIETLSRENSTLNGMAGLSYKLNNLNSISLTGIYNHSTEKGGRYLNGTRPDNIFYPKELEGRELYFRERQMTSLALSGNHVLANANKFEIEWKLSQAQSFMKDPMRRIFENIYLVTTGGYNISASDVRRPFYFFRDLTDNQLDAKLDLTIPLKNKMKIKVGGLYTDKSRDFTEYRYQVEQHNLYTDPFNGNPDDYLADDNFGFRYDTVRSNGTPSYIIGNYMVNSTSIGNQYTGDDIVTAGYAMLTYPITEQLKFVGGARVEKTDIEVTSQDTSLAVGKIDLTDFLPSVNLIYALNDQMNLRASYSNTVARPNMREIASFQSFDPLTKTTYFGNPELTRTKIQNFDLRWEWFMNPGELLAVSAYYKDFKDAITLFQLRSSGNNFKYENVDNANLLGFEIEFRKDLGAFIPALKNFKISTNLSYINSESDVAESEQQFIQSRPFEGQADYIINASLIYSNLDNGLDASLSLNATGDKLAIFGQEGTPDVYDRGRTQLDFAISKKFSDLSVRFTAKNLLNSAFKRSSEFKDRDYLYYEYKRGITYGLSLSYTIK